MSIENNLLTVDIHCNCKGLTLNKPKKEHSPFTARLQSSFSLFLLQVNEYQGENNEICYLKLLMNLLCFLNQFKANYFVSQLADVIRLWNIDKLKMMPYIFID